MGFRHQPRDRELLPLHQCHEMEVALFHGLGCKARQGLQSDTLDEVSVLPSRISPNCSLTQATVPPAVGPYAFCGSQLQTEAAALCYSISISIQPVQ